MAADDPTPAEQAAARAQVVANGWATPAEIDAFIASEGGPRTSVSRILNAFTPTPGATPGGFFLGTSIDAPLTFATPTPNAGLGDLLTSEPDDGRLTVVRKPPVLGDYGRGAAQPPDIDLGIWEPQHAPLTSLVSIATPTPAAPVNGNGGLRLIVSNGAPASSPAPWTWIVLAIAAYVIWKG